MSARPRGGGPDHVTAWRPTVPGIAEVFHASFTEHAYPPHTHDTWTLLVVDTGAIAYDLDRHHHGAAHHLVTLLPPHVPHDGRAATSGGFRKRVVYLDPGVVSTDLIGPAVDRPALADPLLRDRVTRLHDALARPGDELEAETRLALVAERLHAHLAGWDRPAAARRDPGLASRLRDLLDADVTSGLTLEQAATILQAHPTHLVRAFTGRYGIPPHRYLTGRRIDAARRLLLDGHPAADVAVATGFYDQAHLTRHFRRMLGTTPGRYAASARGASHRP